MRLTLTTRVAPDFDIQTDLRAWVGELQHAFRWGRLRLVSGIGHVDGDRKDVVRIVHSDDIFIDRLEDEFQRTNGYLYTLLRWPDPVTWTLGLSAERFDSATSGFSRDQINPKLGILWTPVPGTTSRAAIFRTLKGPLVSNQTIEPTQVAGFNQFFDDPDGTDAWRYGVGVDQRLGSRASVVFSAQELTVPFLEVTGEGRFRHRPVQSRPLVDSSEDAGLPWTSSGRSVRNRAVVTGPPLGEDESTGSTASTPRQPLDQESGPANHSTRTSSS